MWCDGSEPNELLSIGTDFLNLILGCLPPAVLLSREPKQVTMHLQHEIHAELHVRVIRMNRIQHIAVAGDFLLRSITGLDLFLNELSDSIVRRRYTFDTVAGFSTLDHGCLPQRFEHLRRLLFVNFFLALELTERANRPQKVLRDSLLLQKSGFK